MSARFFLVWALLFAAFFAPASAQAQGAPRTDAVLQKGCKAGQLADCSELGFRIWESKKPKPDFAAAFQLASKACDQTGTLSTDDEGCALLALLYVEGKGVEADMKKGEDLALATCSARARTACAVIGIAAEQDKNTSTAMIHYSSVCSAKDYAAPVSRAMVMGCAGLERVQGKPVCKTSINSDGATVDACFDAKMAGWNVKVTPLPGALAANGAASAAAAVPLTPEQQKFADELIVLKAECDKNDAEYCYRLSEYYYTGRGTPENKVLAATILKKACDRTLEKACFALGQMFGAGDGIKQNYAGAAEMFEYSCDYRNFQACYQAGLIIASGTGVTKDPEKAVRLLERACVITSAEAPFGDTGNGIAEACVNLGNAYHEGFGAPQDKEKAYETWRRALRIDPNNAQAAGNLKSTGQVP